MRLEVEAGWLLANLCSNSKLNYRLLHANVSRCELPIAWVGLNKLNNEERTLRKASFPVMNSGALGLVIVMHEK